MTVANWIAIIGIVLGSNLLVSVVQLVAGRLRYDRRADMLKSWEDESKIADRLEAAAGIEGDGTRASKDGARAAKIAFSQAVRKDLNLRIATDLVPKTTWSTSGYLVYGIVAFVSGIVLIAVASGAAVAGWLLLASSIAMLICTGLAQDGRTRLRELIIHTLDGRNRANRKYFRYSESRLGYVVFPPKARKSVNKEANKGRIFNAVHMWGLRNNVSRDLQANVQGFLDGAYSPESGTQRGGDSSSPAESSQFSSVGKSKCLEETNTSHSAQSSPEPQG